MQRLDHLRIRYIGTLSVAIPTASNEDSGKIYAGLTWHLANNYEATLAVPSREVIDVFR